MYWWCVDVKKTRFFDEVKNRPKNSHFKALFRDPQKQPFLTIFRVLTSFNVFMTCWQQILMMRWCWRRVDDDVDDEKVAREVKNDEKNDPQQTLKKSQNGARNGRREPAERKGHKERLWRDRVWQNLPDGLLKKKKQQRETGNGTSSASVAMREAFFDTCAAYPHDWLIPRVGLMKAGTCERSEVCAGITKVREDFFDTKFHDDTQTNESTHEIITISQHRECCVTTHCNKSDVDKKKI
jgi:hypothetical protein